MAPVLRPLKRPVVLVFLKVPGRAPVKTRLAAELGRERAEAVYRSLAESVWRGLAAPDLDRWLVVEPAAARAAAAAWLPGAARVLGQAPGDLGARLAAASAAAFAAGAPAVLVAGTDAPAVDAALARAALAELAAGADAAVVPALDGGYALLALARPAPELFQDIPWSTAGVLAATRDRARAAGLRLAELAPVRDVDTAADLAAVRNAGPGPGGPATPSPPPRRAADGPGSGPGPRGAGPGPA